MIGLTPLQAVPLVALCLVLLGLFRAMRARHWQDPGPRTPTPAVLRPAPSHLHLRARALREAARRYRGAGNARDPERSEASSRNRAAARPRSRSASPPRNRSGSQARNRSAPQARNRSAPQPRNRPHRPEPTRNAAVAAATEPVTPTLSPIPELPSPRALARSASEPYTVELIASEPPPPAHAATELPPPRLPHPLVIRRQPKQTARNPFDEEPTVVADVGAFRTQAERRTRRFTQAHYVSRDVLADDDPTPT